MGLLPDQFYKMIWREYVLMWRAYSKKRTLEFEHTRAICYTNTAPYLKNKMSMQKFWPLETDQENAGNENDHLKKLMKKGLEMAEAMKGTNNNIGVDPQKNKTHG